MKNPLISIVVIFSIIFHTSCNDEFSLSNENDYNIKQKRELIFNKVSLSSDMLIEALEGGESLFLNFFEILEFDNSLILKAINDSLLLTKQDSNRLDKFSDTINQIVSSSSNPQNWVMVEESEVYEIIDEENNLYRFGFVTLFPKDNIYNFVNHIDTTVVLIVFKNSLKSIYNISNDFSHILQKYIGRKDDGCTIAWLKCLEGVELNLIECIRNKKWTFMCHFERECGQISCYYNYLVCRRESYGENIDLSWITEACYWCNFFGVACP